MLKFTKYLAIVIIMMLTDSAMGQTITSLGTAPVASSVRKGGCSVTGRIGSIGYAVVQKNIVKTDVEDLKKETKDMAVTAYPNPFGNEIKVQFPKSSENFQLPTVQIIDNTGKVTNADFEFSDQDCLGEVTIHADNLRQGHYIIRILSGKSNFVVKAVKL